MSLFITEVLERLLDGPPPSWVYLVVIACAWPLSYFSGWALNRYQKIVEEQNAELHKLTAELQEANTHLADQNRDLAKLTSQLEASNAELNAYARTVAHDIKSPLTALVQASDMLFRYADRLERHKLMQYAGRIQESSLHMVRIVDATLLLVGVRIHEDVSIEPLT
ncbi:MAG: histidine kinase dimerization/phospho-acceptor domain-containing protein [Caldilineaceae bacterium]